MSQNAQEYWQEVYQERARLIKVLSSLPESSLQPKDRNQNGEPTCCYVISRRNRDRGTQAGHVILVSMGNLGGPGYSARLGGSAAKLIIDSTHDLATDEQIEAFLKIHKKRRIEIAAAADAKMSLTDVITKRAIRDMRD